MMPDIFIDLAQGHGPRLLRLHDHRGFLERALHLQGLARHLPPVRAERAQARSGGAGAVSRAGDQARSASCRRSRCRSIRPTCWRASVNSLDHATEGRIGWNCVTGSNDGAAQNYGHDKHRPHDERYDVADEFADVVTKLWEAWRRRRGRARPREADVRRRHRRSMPINHEGKYFKVPRADQRAALAAGAGADLPGRRLAARPAVRLALGRHHHHRRRRQRREHEGLSRRGAPAAPPRRAQSRRHQGAVPRPSDHRHGNGGGARARAGWRQADG